MKKLVLSVVAAAALATPALAADLKMVTKAPVPPPSPWDIAFGAALMSDYNFRGISQSNRGPSVTAYSETRYNVDKDLQLYAGSQYWAVTLPTNPTCECDLYAGIRPTFGPLALDFGAIYYWYPKETQHATGAVPAAQFPAFPNGNATLPDTDFWEVYAKGTYTVNDKFSFGFNEFYSPSWLHTGASGNYFSGVFKGIGPSFNLPMYGASREIGWYVSGELGGYWFGTTNLVLGVFNPAVKLPNYATWNLGVAFTWSVFTLDFRYYDTNLSKENCNILTGDPNAAAGGVASIPNPNGLRSNWCSAAFIVTGKFDLTLASLAAALQK